MSTTTRHFNALMRKNVINWKREPCSAVCQLLCPGLLMLILVYVRSRITPEVFNAQTLALLERPQFQIDFTGGVLDIPSTQLRMDEFTKYYEYPFGSLVFDVIQSPASPLNFNPTNCNYTNSWVLPKIESPIIALVGPTNNPVMARIQSYLTALQQYWATNKVNNLTLQAYANIDQLNTYLASETYLYPDPGVCFGIEVTEANGVYTTNLLFQDQIQYGAVIGAGVPPTDQPAWSPYKTSPNIDAYDQLSNDGYAFAQNLVANVILQVETGNDRAAIQLMTVPLPATNIIIDQFSSILSGLFPFFLILIYMGPVYSTVYSLVREKEQRSKESMRMMGMSDLSYWLSWFAFYSLQATIIAFIGWICLCINVIQNGGAGYIFIYMWLFGISVFGQIVFFQAFFFRAKYSGLVSVLFFFMLSFLNLPIQTSGSSGLKALLSFVPQVTLQQMAAIWADFASSNIGINSDNVHQQIYNYTFSEGLWMYIVAFVFWMLIGFYADAVLPKEYGSKKHPCFMFFPSSYKGCCGRQVEDDMTDEERERRSTLLQKDADSKDGMEVRNLKKENYEPVAAEVARSALDGQYLRIENLEKVYDNGFQAVNGINLKIYQNQIFALLGQNGAGKSTTIGVLTGLINASKGTATAFNCDMFKEADKVRQFMGICPQHDVLFDNLTPKEHLSVFYDFKGGNPALKDKEIADLIKDVGLTIDQDKRAGSLSGGNKRKLSVAIALCGGSKLVLFDEPTAGMDLGARRDLWNMLKNYRRDKIIILTTHYMDEADVLGDRIGIMAKGKMMCLGTSLFLKKRFGAGYKITMVKATKLTNMVIKPYLQANLGEVELLSEVASEITFQVSSEVAQNFTTFFQKFDNDLESLGIISYGVSITTLEEVFLKINQEFQINIGNSALEDKMRDQTGLDVEAQQVDQFELQKEQAEHRQTLVNVQDTQLQHATQNTSLEISREQAPPELLIGHASFSSTVRALLTKRLHLYKRDKTGICCEVVVPFMCVIIGCIINGISLSQKSPTLLVEPNMFPTPQRITINNNLVSPSTNFISPNTLFNNLPGSDSDFQANFYDAQNSVQFYSEVYNQASVGSSTPYRYGSYQIYAADTDSQIYSFASYINLTSTMVTAYFPQFMYESILTSAVSVDLNLQTMPFPYPYQLTLRSSSQNSFGYSGFVGFAFCFMPCAIISFILIERNDSLRHMQIISGMGLPAYWVSNMIADMIKLYIPIFIILIVSVIFNANYAGVWVLMLLLPLALVPFTYVTSFLFKSDSQAQIITLLLNYFVCDVMAILIFVLQFIPQTFKLGGILRWAFCIFPTYCVINGLLWSADGQLSLQVRATNPDYPQLSSNIWAMTNLGGDALFLILHFIIDTAILYCIEAGVFQRFRKISLFTVPPPNDQLVLDSDVLAEEKRVREIKTDVIRVSDFRKAYTSPSGPPFLAVERISFGLDYGECFALLGVNGAGKSTTFKSLTADTDPTSGEIKIAGYDITTQFEEARRLIGYCPQKDAIFNLMTVEEHLWFYARIKGIPEHLHQSIVEKAIEELNLSDHRDKQAGQLSGGNKRKLSVAMATLGNPPIILLDEPSAGMDPEARRFMWTVVERISQRDKKSAVILTTHSMEEAEALSTKMGIMVRGGVFKCYGSSQHIKNKFGTGYECEIKIKKPSFAELEAFSDQLGFRQQINTKLVLENAIQTARLGNADETMLDQISEKGLGSDLVFEAAQGGGEIRISNLITFLYTMQYGLKVALLLAKNFSTVELIEQCSDFFKFRIPKENKTIGSLFGLVEDQKKECNISEYSVNQTSLEQIFQTFAVQSVSNEKATLTFTVDAFGNLRTVTERKSTLQKSIDSQSHQN